MIRRSSRIDAIKNRRSHRIAAKETFFLQSTKYTVSRKKHGGTHSSKQMTLVISDEKLPKSLRSRKISFRDIPKKTSKNHDSKHSIALKISERKIEVSREVPPLRRSPRRSQARKVLNELLHKHIFEQTVKNEDSKRILALNTPQRKVQVSLFVAPPLRRSPRCSQVKSSLRRSSRRTLFID